MKKIFVKLARQQYPIFIGQHIVTPELLARFIAAKQLFIVTNAVLAPLYLSTLTTLLSDYQVDTCILPDGEQYKTIASWQKILDELIAHGHHRSTTLIALGGGVIGDMTGFAASCYQRGVNFLQIPTTLLAQVDASVGGKTGVNHPQGKNMIGAFHQPQAVFIDTQFLATLPSREFNAGIAEIIKAALLADGAFFNWLEKNMYGLLAQEPLILQQAISKACDIKAAIVTQDETEQTGMRALLNLGHTFGHALETLMKYTDILHGEAVAIGIVLAARVSQRQGLLSSAAVTRIITLLQSAQLPTTLPPTITLPALLQTMQRDKKSVDSGVRLVLLKNIGEAFLSAPLTQAELATLI